MASGVIEKPKTRSAVPAAAKTLSRRQQRWRKTRTGYLLILPAFVLIMAMMAVPVAQTVIFSVSEVKLPRLSTEFVGFANFVEVVASRDTAIVLRNTVVWIIATLVLSLVLGFIAALIFNANVPGTTWMRTLVILPWAIPSVVGANLWVWMLQPDIGVINATLRSWGLGALAGNWLADPAVALGAVIMAYVWGNVPFVMLMVLAGLQGVPKEYGEAARVDGANTFQVFRHVTLPSLKGVLIIVTILLTVHAINSFDILMIMTGGGPANSTLVWGLDIYRTGFSEFDFGGAAARSVLLFIAGLVAFVFYASASQRVAAKERKL